MPRRTRIIIAVTITALIAVVVTAILIYVNVWSTPTKHDFEQARAEVSTLEKRYGDLSTALQLYSGSIKDINPGSGDTIAKTRYDKAMNAVDVSFSSLDQSRAVGDNDVKVAYDALVKKQQIVQSYSDGFILYRKSFAHCIDVFNVTRGQTDGKKIAAAHQQAASDCLPILTQLEHSKTAYFADYAKNYRAAIQKRQAVFNDYANKKISDSEASAKITDIARTDVRRVLGSDEVLSKTRQDASANNELQRLKAVLDKKSRQF